MRRLRDLDAEIRCAEERLEARRQSLNASLHASGARARHALGSPQALLAAVFVGVLVERLGRARRGSLPDQRKQARSLPGLVAGIGAAALRAAIRHPGIGRALCAAWKRRD
jgi:hypothetical protein